MKKIFFVLSVFFSSMGFLHFAQAQTVSQRKYAARVNLAGKITDGSAMPLYGASIYIPDLKRGTTSNAQGDYTLQNIPAGNYLVQVAFSGYKSIVKNVALAQNTNYDFTLAISITEENEVVITGSSKATSIRRNPIPIVSINKQFLQQNLNTNIIDAISKVPGINAVTTGPNVSKPFIRGLGFNRILTLYDGVRQEGQQWGDEHGIEVDQNSVDKVEVIKGPASLIYGSDAVAGVVNLLPPDPPSDGKISGSLSSEYQSNNRLQGGSAMLSGNKNSVVWLVRGSYKRATNYQNKIDGRVYGTGFREADVGGMLGINRPWGYSHLGVSVFDDLQEIPDGSRDSVSRRFTKQISEADTLRTIVPGDELSSYTITPIHQHIQHYRVYTANNFNLGSGRLGVNLAYQKSHRREFSHPLAPVAGLNLLLNTASYDIKYFFHEQSGWGFTAGVNGMYQDNTVDQGTEFVIPSYHQFDVGPFLFVKKEFEKLEVAGGFRYDVRAFTNKALYTKMDPLTGFEKAVSDNNITGAENPFPASKHTFSGFSGSLGLSYRLSQNFTAKLNIGRGFRSPNISEISTNGIHPGTNIFQLGNSHFKPEFNLQEDLAVNYNTPHITIIAEVFNNDIQNYIFNQKVLNNAGQDSVIVPGNQTFQFQAARAHLYGGELTIDIHPHPLDWLHFENSLSVVYGNNKGASNQAKVPDSAKYLPLIPPVHTFSEVRVNIKKVSPSLANAFIKMQMEYYARQKRAYFAFNTETATPGYNLLNAGLGTDITNDKGHTLFTISFLGNNLFNTVYQSHLNRLKYFEDYPNDPGPYHGIYNMGRNFSIKVNVPLAF